MAVVGIDYTPAYEQGGGIGRYVRELVQALAALETSHQFSLFVSGASKAALPSLPGDNFSWKNTFISPKWLARVWHRARLPLPIDVFLGKLDIYHATDFVLPPTLSSVKTVLTVHDLSFVRVPDSASPSLKAYLDVVVPRSAKRATHILADSIATKDDLLSLYGIPSSKITVLLSGVNSIFTRSIDHSLVMTTRSKYRIGKEPYIFTIGTVQPRKNYIRLIQALKILHTVGLKVHLVISGGKGWLDDPIYTEITNTGLHQFIHFIGYADDKDLPSLYSGSVCFAFPSLYEGFGLPVLEAMACGSPVLTSNISSLPEVAGDAALMVDPYDVEAIADGLKKLIEDNLLRETLINKGLTRAKEFTWQKSAHQLLSIYNSLTA